MSLILNGPDTMLDAGYNGTGIAIAAGKVVKIVTGGQIANPGIAPASAISDQPYGATADAISNDRVGTIIRSGRIKVTAGVGGFAIGDRLSPNASGDMVIAVANSMVVAIALEAAIAAAEGVVLLVSPYWYEA